MADKKLPVKPSTGSQVDPVTFMRSRHPDLYSDSAVVETQQLSEQLLEYHLDTITNRNQESDFAHFARRLSQKEICPNLRPQTGPAGGGDSKADSETIPVSSEVSELWAGSDPKAASERWAFAFSAKKDWKGKVRHDVKSIASTKRPYTKIFFITNQFAPDKSRANSEDALTKEFGIPVTILDRTWIVKVVMENGRQDIAIEALHIDELKSLTEKRLGPSDTERLAELEELERNLADPEFYRGARYQLVEDSLRVALLARGLGRSRAEIDGYFIRAERIATELDSDKQRLRVAYNAAWTAIFWFDDYNTLNAAYAAVENFALKSPLADDVELAANLWMVLRSQVQRGVLSKEAAKLDQRRDALVAALNTLASDATRPNNALQAKTAVTLIEMQGASSHEELDAIWSKFQEIVKEAEGLGDYPFEHLGNLLGELDGLGIDSPEFDALFESVVATLEKRRSEVSGAGLLRDHGFRKLQAGKPYEAISLLGRAMERFVKREHRDDLIFCLMALSTAYSSVGLLWAARSCALAATERCFAYFREDGQLVRFSLSALQELMRVELHLGRVPQMLMCAQLENVLVPQLRLPEERLERVRQHRETYEGVMGICLLSSTIDQLRLMDGLPEALEELGLFIPKALLLYALGYRDELRDEGFTKDGWSDADLDNFMKLAFEQPGRLQIPEHPQIEDGAKVVYKTNILGCEIVAEIDATSQSISVGEAVLGTLEAFFATSLGERIIPYRQNAKIVIEPSVTVLEGLAVSIDDAGGEAFIHILHPNAAPALTRETRGAARDGLITVIASVIAHIAIVEDTKAYIDKMGGEERAFARALIYSESSLAQENLFGESIKPLLSDWQPAAEAKRFPLKRSTPWTDGISFSQIPLPADEADVREPAGGAQEYAKGFAYLRETKSKHSDRKIASLIDIPLWNSAEWGATFYGRNPDWSPYPILGLAFRNQSSAEKIFRGWRRELGDTDKDDRLRIVILTGADRASPASYKVFITANVREEDFEEGDMMVSVGRINMMTPTTTENLDRFIRDVNETKRFLLVPAHLTTDDQPGDIGVGLGIVKERLVVRPAWEVGINDIDSPAFKPDDDPIIPEGMKDAPILGVLKDFREKTKAKTKA